MKIDGFECSTSTSWSSSVLVSGSDVHHWLKHKSVKKKHLDHRLCCIFKHVAQLQLFFCFYQLSLFRPFLWFFFYWSCSMWWSKIVMQFHCFKKFNVSKIWIKICLNQWSDSLHFICHELVNICCFVFLKLVSHWLNKEK